MTVLKRILALAAAVCFLAACSREGFEASLDKNRADSSESPQSSSQQEEQKPSSDEYIFDIEPRETAEGNACYYYGVPEATDKKAEKSAAKITERIETAVLSAMEEVAAGRDVNYFLIYDAVTKNDGEIFSVCYDIEFRSEKGGETEKYAFGLVFDSVTGEQKKLDSFIEPDVIATLLADSQGSSVSEKDNELAAKKRDYLNEQGSKKLKKRLLAEGGLDVLLNASFHIDGNEIVCAFSAPQDIGGVVKVSVNI